MRPTRSGSTFAARTQAWSRSNGTPGGAAAPQGVGTCNQAWLCLDVQEQCLLRGEWRQPLTPRAFALLYQLVRQPQVAVSTAELLRGAWPGLVVEPGQVKQLMCVLRTLLHDDPACPRFIETVRGRGYRYLGGIDVVGAPVSLPGPAAAPGGRHALGTGAVMTDLHGVITSPAWHQAARRLFQGQRVLCVVHGDATAARPTLAALSQGHKDSGGPALVLTVHCAPACSDEEFSPLLDTLDELCSAPEGHELRQAVRRFAPSWALQLPWCFDAAEPGVASTLLLPSPGAGRMRREFGRLLQELAGRRPVVLCVLDAQDADAATRRLLDYLAMQAAPARLLVLVTTRDTMLAQALVDTARRYSDQLVLTWASA